MQEKRRYYFFLWCASTLGVLSFIFCNSLLPADSSVEQSEKVFGVLQTLLFFFPFLTHGMVRTLAHAAEFALLGAHFALLPRFFCGKTKALRVLALFSGLLFPLIDEGIQFFVPGRGASLFDVLTDAVGYLFGAGMMLVLYHFFRPQKGERYVQKNL